MKLKNFSRRKPAPNSKITPVARVFGVVGNLRATRLSIISVMMALAVGSAAQAAITFNFTWDANIPAGDLVNVQNATIYAANQIKASFNDSVTLNITVASMTTGLGMSSAGTIGPKTFAEVKTALTSDKSTADDNTAVANLPGADPTGGTNFRMARGLAKALGLLGATDAASDGTFFYNKSESYAFDPNNRAVSGAYDFIGIAEHELTELMGRVVFVNSSGNGWRPLDLFRFTSSGRSTSAGDADVYFSIDGTTLLKKFNLGGGGDLGDWANGQGIDAFNAFGGTNSKEDMSAVDLRVMDVIGWNAVPEPSTYLAGALLLLPFAGSTIRSLRNRKKVA